MSTVKRKHTATTGLALLALLAGLFAFAVPVGADNPRVIQVSSEEIGDLYDAVYDELGNSRENVTIFLEPGVYALEIQSETESRPFGGRLVLGDGTVLYSTLRMAVDDNGVPLVDDESGEPTVLEEGAVIDGSGLVPDPFGEGIIVVGYKGQVARLTVAGGILPGIEVTTRGTVSGVYSWGHSMGFRVRAASAAARTHGTLKGNVSTGNFAGISILTNESARFGDDRVDNAVVRATLIQNACVGNYTFNLAVLGGLGTNNNDFHVTVSGNVFRGVSPDSVNIAVVGGEDFYSPGANHNSVKVALDGNFIADGRFGLALTGGSLQDADGQSDLSIPREQRKSSNNRVVVTISDTTFQGYDSDDTWAISAVASYADPGADLAGGDDNTVQVTVDGGPLRTQEHNCLWPAGYECTSEATITYE
jgi:hypothetical protein